MPFKCRLRVSSSLIPHLMISTVSLEMTMTHPQRKHRDTAEQGHCQLLVHGSGFYTNNSHFCWPLITPLTVSLAYSALWEYFPTLKENAPTFLIFPL